MNVDIIKNFSKGFIGAAAFVGVLGIARCNSDNYEKEEKAQTYNDSIISEEKYKMELYNHPLGNSFEEKIVNLSDYLKLDKRLEIQQDIANAVNEYNMVIKEYEANKEYAKTLKNDIIYAKKKLDYYDTILRSIDEIENQKKSEFELKKDSLFLENVIPKFEEEIREHIHY